MSRKQTPLSHRSARSQNRPPYELLCIAVIFFAAAVMLFFCDGNGVVLMHSGGSRFSSGPVTGAESLSAGDLKLLGLIPLFLGGLTIWAFLRIRK